MRREQVIVLEHESEILRGNPLGDPTVRELVVYLPPGYADSEDRYPVIWALPAFMGWGERMFNVQAWDENLSQRADRLIREGQMPPVLIAFPDCFTRYGGSQYLNSSAVGRYEDYLVQELVPYLDRQFRTRPARDHRALIGHSSGGFGALTLAMSRPELFGAVACHSGDMGFEHALLPDIPGFVRTMGSFGSLEAFLDSFTLPYKSKDWYSALNIIAMSACYSPNPASPHGFDLPCDPYTGQITDEVWARWLQHDPVAVAPAHADALRRLGALYFDCGTRDEYNLFLGARQMHQSLDLQQVPHVYEEFDGGHGGINWRYDRSLPLLASAIARGKKS